MNSILKKIGAVSSFLTKYIGIIIILFSVLAFFWQDGFAWTTQYTSIFLGVAMFGMGLTIRMGDFGVVFTHPKEICIGCVTTSSGSPTLTYAPCLAMRLLTYPPAAAVTAVPLAVCRGARAWYARRAVS